MVTASRPSASASAMAPLTIVSRLSRSRATDPLLLFAIPPTVLCTGWHIRRQGSISVYVAESLRLRQPLRLHELGDALAGFGLLFVILRALVDGGEELREFGSGLLAFRAEVRPLEDAPEPQHGLQNVVVVDAEVIDPALGDEDRVLPKVGHPGAGHGETDDLVTDRAHGGIRRDLQGCGHDVAVEHHVQILVDGDPGK